MGLLLYPHLELSYSYLIFKAQLTSHFLHQAQMSQNSLSAMLTKGPHYTQDQIKAVLSTDYIF
jgi:hypothetical protein